MNKFDNVPYLGAMVAFLGGLTLNDWASLFGILFGFTTVLINFYYKHKEYQLREISMKLRLQNAEKKVSDEQV